jgi:ribosomal protein S12 methylthiotransferase accessory factor
MHMSLEVGTGDIHDLVQSHGGLFGHQNYFRAQSDEPRFRIQTIQLGDVSQIWPHIINKWHSQTAISGAGAGLEEGEGTLPALAEGVERYCACAYAKEQFISATADELGDDALDLDTVPRCSPTELSRSRCPIVAPDKKTPIRWVRGLSVLDGRPVYIPAVMVYLYAGFASPEERFWFPITTGCAAHTSLERALLSAVLEVIERDAISITWLQQLRLPRIEIDRFSPSLAASWDRYQSSSSELEYAFFDATTDLGVPIIYALQVARANPRLTTLVSCSTALDPADAIVKAMRDMAACRIAFRVPRPAPETVEEFSGIFHGASYMARAEQAPAFEFLLGNGKSRRLSEIAGIEAKDDRQALQTVLDWLRRRRFDVYAVELSTDEALRAAMRVVRVLIPGLQPLSFHYRARFLAHARLYDAPAQMGYPVYGEEQLNHWPQPFA